MSSKPQVSINNSTQKITDNKSSQRSIKTQDKSSSSGSGSRKYFDPQLQEFTRKKLFKFQNYVQNKKCQQQKFTFNQIVQKVLFALQHFYCSYSGFYLICKQFLINGWQIWKIKILQRFNTYQILSDVLKKKSFSYIQKQVIKEFKKNYLLYGIMTYWYDWIQKNNLKDVKEFQKQYQLFRQFLSQISYLIFKGWFSQLQKKKNLQILDKIFSQTTHFIITQFSQWKKIYHNIIKPLIQNDLKNKQIEWNYDLNKLNIKKIILSDELEGQLPNNLKETIQSLRLFSQQIKLSKKVDFLRDVRVTLQKQIIQNQRLLIVKKIQKSYQILQKDDFIIAHIYCIINGKLKQIQQSMKYLQILLGSNLQLLSKMQLDSYAIDIIVAIESVLKKQINKQSQQDTIVIHSLIHNTLKSQSNHIIQDNVNTTICSFGEINLKNYQNTNYFKIKNKELSMKYMKITDQCLQEQFKS